MASTDNCKGFLCGGIIKAGSITNDKFDKESFVEYIKNILKEESTESWFKEVFETVLKGSIDSDWLKEFFEDLLKKYTTEQWFKDLICGMGCVGEPDTFDVIPTDITFEATGGTATVQIIVNDDDDWEMTD